ncbi:MAG: PEP-CTERM sorting domain-containing protein, partial [Armatimonadota bacterium]
GGGTWGACYWDSPTSITEIPQGSITANYGQANAVSYDGTYIASVYRDTATSTRRAFIWDSVNGTRDLETVLVAAGIDLTGWQLVPQSDISPFSWYGITGISSDGKWISGIGLKNGVESGWVALIPEPSTLTVLAVGLLALIRRRK